MDKTAVQHRARSGHLAGAAGRRDAARGGCAVAGVRRDEGRCTGRGLVVGALRRSAPRFRVVCSTGTVRIASSPGDGRPSPRASQHDAAPLKAATAAPDPIRATGSVLTFVKDGGL